jgi:hypothetical protein
MITFWQSQNDHRRMHRYCSFCDFISATHPPAENICILTISKTFYFRRTNTTYFCENI